MNFFRLLALFLCLVSGAVASPRSIVDTDSRWSSSRIPVCFANENTEISKYSSLEAELQHLKTVNDGSLYNDRVRSVVNAAYTREKTGMAFTSWTDCNQVRADDFLAPAFVFTDTSLEDFGLTTVGDQRIRKSVKEQKGLLSGSILNLRSVADFPDYSVLHLAKTLASTAPESEAVKILATAAEIDHDLIERIRDATIVHEFGHLAGLLHEEARKDVKNQPDWCRSADDTASQDPSEKTYGTVFDPFSIMNYCSDDIAKGFAFYHLLCAYPDAATAFSVQNAGFDWKKVSKHCETMQVHEYSATLSIRDQAALRKLYLGTEIPQDELDYRSNPDEVDLMNALMTLYKALPDSEEFAL